MSNEKVCAERNNEPVIGYKNQNRREEKNIERSTSYESVDLLGFWFEIKTYEKNNHRHIFDIPRIIFFA